MTKIKFAELLIERIIVASLIASFSTAILFGYNLFSKRFDSTQEQSRAFSSFAISQREAVLAASKEIRTALSALYFRATAKDDSGKKDNKGKLAIAIVPKDGGFDREQLPTATKLQYDMIRRLGEIDSASNWLLGSGPRQLSAKTESGTFAESTLAAQAIGLSLGPLVSSFRSADGSLPADVKLKEEFAKVDQLEAKFIRAFDRELATALSQEFLEFFEAYYRGVPWYGQPVILIVLAAGAALLSMVTYFLLPGERPSANQSNRLMIRLIR
jgi:hypothetical protein